MQCPRPQGLPTTRSFWIEAKNLLVTIDNPEFLGKPMEWLFVQLTRLG
jgi:hypothetical protein